MTPDVNVLVAAFRADHPHHPVARAWLEEALGNAQAGARFTVMPMVFVTPTPIEQAVSFIDALLAVPGVHLATLGPEWPKLQALCLAKQLQGNDLPDAWLAAAVEHAGEHLASFDRDFRKLLGRGRFTLLMPPGA